MHIFCKWSCQENSIAKLMSVSEQRGLFESKNKEILWSNEYNEDIKRKQQEWLHQIKKSSNILRCKTDQRLLKISKLWSPWGN